MTTKQAICFAVLCGAGVTSFVLILVRILSASPISLFFGLLLVPGGSIAHSLAGSQDSDSPLLVFGANAFVYAAVVFLIVFLLRRRIAAEKIRLTVRKLLVPVAILVGLICIPALNPLWPRNMVDLAAQEHSLQNTFSLGMGLDQARAALRSKRIDFSEEIEKSASVLLRRQKKTITAAAGDRVISARLETEASQFPCGYNIEIVLLFGQDDKIKDQYIHRLRLCP